MTAILDLYVANDFGRNNLYRNDGGRFVDVAGQAGVEDMASGMSASWGDYNQDGHMDLYVGNMFSSAGNRIAYQQRFKPEAGADARAGICGATPRATLCFSTAGRGPLPRRQRRGGGHAWDVGRGRRNSST